MHMKMLEMENRLKIWEREFQEERNQMSLKEKKFNQEIEEKANEIDGLKKKAQTENVISIEDLALLQDDLKHVQAERLEASRQVDNLKNVVSNLQRKLQDKKTESEEEALLAGGQSSVPQGENPPVEEPSGDNTSLERTEQAPKSSDNDSVSNPSEPMKRKASTGDDGRASKKRPEADNDTPNIPNLPTTLDIRISWRLPILVPLIHRLRQWTLRLILVMIQGVLIME